MSHLNYDPRPPERRTVSVAQPWRQWVALGGAGTVVLGSLLPWATVDTVFGSVSRNGTTGDGKLTLAGGLAFALLYFGNQRAHAIIATVVACGVAAVGFHAITSINDAINGVEEASDGFATAEVGVGVWLVMVGAGAMLLGIFDRATRPTQDSRP